MTLRKKNIIFLSAFLFLFLSYGYAGIETIIPTNRTMQWSNNVGIPDGIINRSSISVDFSNPSIQSQYKVYPNDVLDSSEGITQALKFAPENSVVFLPEGTYMLMSAIDFDNKKNVTLRGAGPDKTILISKSTTGPAITSASSAMSSINSILSGYTKGSTTVTLANAQSIHVGSLLSFFQANDSFIVWSSSSLADVNRQRVIVTAINGNEISFSPPLVRTFSYTLNPRWQYQTNEGVRLSGIEDLSIKADPLATSSLISLDGTYGVWIKNVELSFGSKSQISISNSLKTEIRDSYMHDTYGNNGGIGIECLKECSGLLIENNIFTNLLKSVVLSQTTASVISYNYSTGDFVANNGAHSMMNLWEGNIAKSYKNDSKANSDCHTTLFRNWFIGAQAIVLSKWSLFESIVGNILGSSSLTPSLVYETDLLSPKDEVIYSLDSNVTSSLLRWGNFDFYNKAIQRNSSEIPTNVSLPQSNTLPDSMYLSEKPSWMAPNQIWPVLGADIEGEVSNPALTCYQNILENNVLFNANNCYNLLLPMAKKSAAPLESMVVMGPSIPDNLTAIVQSNSQVNLSWSPSIPCDAPVIGYMIYRCEGVNCVLPNLQKYTTSLTSFGDGAVVAGKTYTYAVAAYDDYGDFSAKSNPITITVADNITVSILYPVANIVVQGTITILANANNTFSGGLANVQFKLDGANLGSPDTVAPYNLIWDTTTASEGTHSLTAVATNKSGTSVTSAPISFLVQNNVVTYGDLYPLPSGNGTIDQDDALFVGQAVVGLATFSGPQIQKADVSGNQTITMYDAALISQRAANIITKFPVQP